MDYLLFGKASVIGLSIAAPVGPIGLLCMQRTLAGGMSAGFVSGLGAASADAIYGAIGAFGLSAVTQLFTELATPLALFGGLFLLWMGVRLLRASAASEPAGSASRHGAISAFGSTFLLTLANPMTILSFVAVFSALGGSQQLSSELATTMVVGVFTGSALWWLALAVGVSLLRHRIEAAAMRRISQLAACLLIAFALWQLQSVLWPSDLAL